MSVLSQFGGGSGIKSIQRGVFTLDTTPTAISIASVNTSKSVLYHLGQSSASQSPFSGTAINVDTFLFLSSSTQITTSPAFSSQFQQISWQLVEYY